MPTKSARSKLLKSSQRSNKNPEGKFGLEQRAQFDAEGYFEVTGSHTGRRYRICQGTVGNVLEVDKEGQPKVGWCFAPERALAAGDVMLAQKIALETDEMAVLALANRISPKLPRLPHVVRRAY